MSMSHHHHQQRTPSRREIAEEERKKRKEAENAMRAQRSMQAGPGSRRSTGMSPRASYESIPTQQHYSQQQHYPQQQQQHYQQQPMQQQQGGHYPPPYHPHQQQQQQQQQQQYQQQPVPYQQQPQHSDSKGSDKGGGLFSKFKQALSFAPGRQSGGGQPDNDYPMVQPISMNSANDLAAATAAAAPMQRVAAPMPQQSQAPAASRGAQGSQAQPDTAHVRDMQHRISVLEAQLQEVDEIKRQLVAEQRSANDWKDKWNYQV
jgi:hypothetical protein